MSKARKFVRPRLKTEPGSRVGRVVKLGGGAEGGRGANVVADSTTESDDAGKRTFVYVGSELYMTLICFKGQANKNYKS